MTSSTENSFPVSAVLSKPQRSTWQRLLGYLKPYWRLLLLAGVCLIGVAITEPLFAALMKPLLDRGFSGVRPSYVWLIPLAIVSIFIFRGIFTFSSAYLISKVSNQVLSDLRQEMFNKLLRLPDGFFKNTPTSSLLNRFIVDAGQAIQLTSEVLTTLLRDTLVLMALMGLLFYLSWKLTLIALVLIPLAAWVSRVFSRRLRRINADTLAGNSELTRILLEGIEGQRVIKLYGGYQYENTRFSEINRRLQRFGVRNTIAWAATVPITQIIASIALAVVVAIALSQSGSQTITVGEFAAFITAMLQMLSPLKQLANINGPMQRMLVSAESVFYLLDQAAEQDKATKQLAHTRGDVQFIDVGYQFPGSEQAVLSQINLHVSSGQTVAIVGRSGSGKTTLMSLVPRFAEPHSGMIQLDGINIADLSLDNLRSHIALVSQDVVLFDDTIAANVSYGAHQTPSAQTIEAALASANLLEFVQSLPDGLETRVGENATRLSGGQRQRLAIARALIKDAPILILDEATSALDSESERQVQSSLERLMQGRTTLVIAHRLSTVQHADCIVVMDQGRIVERGSHQQLLEQGGLYASLYSMQFRDVATTE